MTSRTDARASLPQPVLETARLVLRPLRASDAAAIQAAAASRAIADTMISIPHPYPDGEAERYVARQLAEAERGRASVFVIAPKGAAALVGIVEVREIEREHSQAEMSFWTAEGAWGRGYMSEALGAVVAYGFEVLGINRLYAYHMVRNPASGRVLEKNGFRKEGLLRQRVRKWGVFEDVVLMAMLREDWDAHRSQRR